MQRRAIGAGGLVLAVAMMLAASPAHALIVRLTPLSHFLEESQFVFLARVEAVDAARPSMVLTVEKQLKGKAPFARLPINLKGDNVAAKGKEAPLLLKRVGPKVPVVVFVMQDGKDFLGFGYTNGTWFGLAGTEVDGAVRWSFRHLETYLRRTYKGTTDEMVQTVSEVLAKKRKPPPFNAKEKPGLGPELPPPKKAACEEEELPAGPPALGLIAAPPIAALLAILAMMFPTVFGGWKRWLVLLTVLATNSTLYGLQYWFATSLGDGWWGSSAALWLVMTCVVVLGSAWAWQRHLTRVQAEEAPLAPGKPEVIVLSVLSLGGLTTLAVCYFLNVALLKPDWLPMLAFSCAIWAATLYAICARLRAPVPAPAPAALPEVPRSRGEGIVTGLRPSLGAPYVGPRAARPVPALATEVVVLTALVLACTGLGAVLPAPRGGSGDLDRGVELGDASPPGKEGKLIVRAKVEDREVVSAGKLLWTFRLPEKGALASSPLPAGDRVYVAAAFDSVFRPYGALFCLNAETGKEVWRFDDGKKMKQVYSSPCLADGKLYIGEGFHQDANCRIFCIDADTGEKVWEFATASHTESSPVVVGGRVYCGAGDDGLFCLNATTGEKVWQFEGFHVDANPVVVGDRVYTASGVGDYHKQTFVFCLDAKTGKSIWRQATDHSVWAEPAVIDGHVYVGTGNGRLNEEPEKPAGGVICLRASDGERVWTKNVGDAVFGRVRVDERHAYFGCRDRSVYCLERDTGKQVWRRRVGSPVGTSIALARSEGQTNSLYAAAMGGQVYCLGPNTSRIYWGLDLGTEVSAQPELLSSPIVEVRAGQGEEVRRLYLGLTLLSTARTGQLRCYEDRRSLRE